MSFGMIVSIGMGCYFGRKKGRVGRRREKGWEDGRSAVWTKREN